MSSNALKINDEYAALVPPLTQNEYTILKNSIKKSNGNIVPITINQDRIILDGHHRYRACLELDLTAKIEVKEFDGTIEQKEIIIDLNLNRRQLNDFQKAELGYKLHEIEKERARVRQLTHLKDVKEKLLPLGSNDHNGEKGSVTEILSRRSNVSPKTYQRATKIIELGSDEVKQKLREGKTTISKEYQKIQKEQKKRQLMSKVPKMELPENCQLFHGDFEEIGKNIPDNSIDLIFTDPPYGSEGLEIYEKLGRLANRVLKQGGSLVTYAGQYYLNRVFKILEPLGLKYWWIIAVRHKGPHANVHQRSIFANWKPLLWYVKGESANNLRYFIDYVESMIPDKISHDWEQSIVEAEHTIKELTQENQIVLDVLMGSGTTGEAALKLGRKFIGIEIDEQHFKIAKIRLNGIINSLANKLDKSQNIQQDSGVQ